MNTIGGDRKKRAGASSKSMTVGGTFRNASAAANISESSKALSEEVASAIIGSGEFSNKCEKHSINQSEWSDLVFIESVHN